MLSRLRTGGTLDLLVNNAGRDFLMPLLDANIKEAKKFFDVNFWSVLAVTQAFAPMVIKAKGVVANHSSIVANLAITWGGRKPPATLSCILVPSIPRFVSVILRAT